MSSDRTSLLSGVGSLQFVKSTTDAYFDAKNVDLICQIYSKLSFLKGDKAKTHLRGSSGNF